MWKQSMITQRQPFQVESVYGYAAKSRKVSNSDHEESNKFGFDGAQNMQLYN
jgi:hypothetical protein